MLLNHQSQTTNYWCSTFKKHTAISVQNVNQIKIIRQFNTLDTALKEGPTIAVNHSLHVGYSDIGGWWIWSRLNGMEARLQ